MLIKIVNAGDEIKRDDLDEVLYKLVEEAEADGLAPVQNESGVYELVGEVLGSLTEGSPAAGLIPVLQELERTCNDNTLYLCSWLSDVSFHHCAPWSC